MDSKLATSFFLSDWQVYGYRLKPFCLLHSLQLEALESPIISGGEIAPHDVLVAAVICSKYGGGISEALTMRAKWRDFWHDPDTEFAKLSGYMIEGRSYPDLMESPEGTRGSPWKAPWQLTVVTTLVRCSNITERRAWTMPEGLAMWYFHTVREQESGQSALYPEDEQRADAELVRINEENRPRDEKRCFNIGEYHRRSREGTWPKDVEFEIDMDLPPKGPQ